MEGDLRLQEAKITRLEGEFAKRNERVSQLTIHPGERSQYILRPLNSIPRADFSGGYFEFRLRVENRGARNSIVLKGLRPANLHESLPSNPFVFNTGTATLDPVNKYRIEIRELGLDLPNLLPEEGKSIVQGRNCQFAMNRRTGLSETKIIQIGPESSTKEGTLAFFIPELSLSTFTGAGLTMHGEHRQFGVLHCRLTLTDSSGVTASAEFEPCEA